MVDSRSHCLRTVCVCDAGEWGKDMMGSAIRDLRALDAYRDVRGGEIVWGWAGDETCGLFRVPSPIDKGELTVIVSSGEGWDHVSVSRRNRCPNWTEMEHVKRMFFRDDAVAYQLHVPPAKHISLHDYCLHIWRPQDAQIPMPPSIMVAFDAPEENERAMETLRG